MSFIADLFVGPVTAAAKLSLENGLQKLHDSDPQRYKQALLIAKAFVNIMEPVVDKTKTRLDDHAIQAVEDAVTDSAEKNSVDLSAVDALLAEAEKLA